jgi:hypothetical protein
MLIINRGDGKRFVVRADEKLNRVYGAGSGGEVLSLGNFFLL